MSDTPLFAACRRALTGILGVSLLAMAAAAAAQSPTAGIQPKAAEVLEAASETLASASMLTFRAITYVQEPGEPELMATLSDWNLNAYLDDGMFHATPPKDAKQVSFDPRSK